MFMLLIHRKKSGCQLFPSRTFWRDRVYAGQLDTTDLDAENILKLSIVQRQVGCVKLPRTHLSCRVLNAIFFHGNRK